MTGLLNRVILSYGSVDAGHEEIPFTLQEQYHFEEASILMRLTFEWLSPLFKFGNVKGRLDMDDLRKWHLPLNDSTDKVVEQYRSSWKKETQKAHFNNMKPNLARALWNAYYLDFCKAGSLKLVHDMFQFVAPQVLKALIVYLRSPAESIWYGITLTLIIAVAQIIMSISLRQYYFTCYRVGLRIRTAMITAIYKKALSIQSCQKSTGQITNLMSIDVQHLQDIVTSLHSLWYSVFQIVVSLIFLWQQMGVSIFAGVLVIILSIPLTAISASYMGWRQKSLMIAKDNRLEVNNEVIGNMKVIKLQAWEEPFMKKIVGLRKEELRQLWFYLIGRMFTYLTFAIVPLAISLATFSAYIFLGNRLDVASALTSLALFEILRFPLFMLPQTINGMVEAHIALNRINKFLVGPEYKAIKSDSFGSKGIRMLRATFLFDDTSPEVEDDDDTDQKIADTEWKATLLQEQINDAEGRLAVAKGRDLNIQSSLNFALARINLSVKEGELIAVIGGVGSGKSSLLKALMGNLSQFSGELEINGKISYAAQATFIMNASIKENILFGNSIYNHELYHRALDVCCLEHDLKLLTSGDETEIGEKGINLSGGQKARIGMARALYHNADIFLLDDPLAAVDAHVGKTLFEECIVGSMLKPSGNSSQRTVVLVTNALQYLSHPFVDRIIVLHEGNLVEAGTFKELNQKEESHFKRHLNAFNETKSGHSHQGRSSEAFDIDTVEKKEEIAIHLTNSERDTQSISNFTPLMTDEYQERETGSVSLSVYLMWAEAAGGRWTIGVIAFIFSLGEASKLLSNWWLTYWSANADGDMQSQMYYLVIYALINVTAISCSIAESVSILLIALRASRKLFTRVLDAIIRCPLSFFDTTPLGRIMNRFSKGTDTF
jgi:ATP-binding cassette, subfamily C (CFTR/MRP), member 1